MNINRLIKSAAFLALPFAAAVSVTTSCTDDIKFGDSFQEKAPGGTMVFDSVFVNERYTRGFLASIYSYQTYGLPYGQSGLGDQSCYRGKLDAVTDLYQLHWSSTTVYNVYYQAQLSETNPGLLNYTSDGIWDCVRLTWQFLENVDKCTAIDANLRNRFKAEAKCVMASRYFDLLMSYGGVPIVKNSFTGNESSYKFNRATLAETVDFIVSLLDESIDFLPWAYNGDTPDDNTVNNRKRWSKAGAMALKAKVLTFAASPIFNDEVPYYDGNSEAEKQNLVWYGDKDDSRWTRALKACEDFFTELNANGYYALEQPKDVNDVHQCRLAYRKGYLQNYSTEPLHITSVRDYDNNGNNAYYNWVYWVNLGRNSYLPTEEYMEMFPWKDGSKFDWKADSVSGKIFNSVSSRTGKAIVGQLFFKYNTNDKSIPASPTRDPRLYENVAVNGMQMNLNWSTGVPSGNELELWVNGVHAGTSTLTDQMTSQYSTGYGVMKYHLLSQTKDDNGDYMRLPLQWVMLGLDEMYLMYAECLAQTGNLAEANKQVQVIRDRVGLRLTLDKSYPDVLTDKDAMIEQILRERACELGMSNNRYYDMIRYKRTDWMTKRLHGLRTYRQVTAADGKIVDNNSPYIGDEKNGGAAHPYLFRYERFELFPRVLWNYAPDDLYVRKYLLSPFPLVELNKEYGLVQNPGW